MYQCLHCADLHLNTTFAGDGLPPEVGNRRRSDLWATLGHILSIARERQVNALTIAGDLFEQSYALPDTADLLAQQFAKLAPIQVLIAPGECDPFTHDSLYALPQWPENVTIFSSGSLSPVELAPGLHLWGARCPPDRAHKELKSFHVDRAGVNLLLLHAAQSEQATSESVFSLHASTIQKSGLDLALLGHQHGAGILRHDKLRCIYPGSPEPLSWSEAEDQHGIMLVQVHDQQCKVKHIPLAQWRYASQEVDLTGCETADERRARVEQVLATVPGGLDDRTICRITLHGQSAPESCLEEWTERIRSPAILQFKTRFVPVPDLDVLAQEQTVRGLLVQHFQARLQGTATEQERRQISSALRYALSALDGKQVQLDEVD